MSLAIGQENKDLYAFGAFRLDARERVLTRDGERISLAPKAFDTLLMLVHNSGHVLSKDQLIKSLWPDSFVEENNLTQQISQLRRALSDGMDGESYIETVPKLGYRFLPEVREVGGEQPEALVSKRTRTHIVLREEIEEESDQATDAPVLVRSVTVWRKAVLFAVVLISLALAGFAIYRYRDPKASQPLLASSARRSLAVLPLRNLKPDPETDFLSMALTDAIISRLGYVSEINVEPLSSVAKYRGGDADAQQIGRELKVQNVLAASYLKEGDVLRVTMELISADKNAVSRRENFELKYEKLFTLQDRVAVSAIHSMGLELLPQEVERLNKGLPTNPAAYEYYLRGIDKGFKSDWASAVKLLEESVALEPENAMAWTELATGYLAYGSVQGDDSAFVEKGWQAFHRAIDLDPANRFIVDLMAFDLLEHNKSDQAIPLLQESLRHNPADSFAHWYLSEAYRYGGSLEQSVAEGELALKLNPRVAENQTFNTYLYVGQYGKFLASLPHDEENARTVFYRGLAQFSQGDTRSAVEEFDHAFALNPGLLHAQIGRALASAVRRENAQGLELIRRIEHSGGDDGEMVYKMAQAYAQLGDRQSALRLLHRSVELNFYPYAYFARDPLLEPLRGDAGYAAVMEEARQRQEVFLKTLQ